MPNSSARPGWRSVMGQGWRDPLAAPMLMIQPTKKEEASVKQGDGSGR